MGTGEGGDDLAPRGPTQLELNAEALGYHPREGESYHAWEYGFIQHCVRAHGRFVHRHYGWYVEQGFRPVLLRTFLDVAHQPRQGKERKDGPMLSDAQKGLLGLVIIVASLGGFYIFLPDETEMCLVVMVMEFVGGLFAFMFGRED